MKHRSLLIRATIIRTVLILACLLVLFLFQVVIDRYLETYLDITPGFLIWGVLASMIYLEYTSYNRTIKDSDDDFSIITLEEYSSALQQRGNPLARVKLDRFMRALRDVYSRVDSIVPTNIRVVLSHPSGVNPAFHKYSVSTGGINGHSTLFVSQDSIQADDLDQEIMSFIIAHEVGHHNNNDPLRVFVLIRSLLSLSQNVVLFFLVASVVTFQFHITAAILVVNTLFKILFHYYLHYQEYLADAFASGLGFSNGGVRLFQLMLEEGLDKGEKDSITDPSYPKVVDRYKHQQQFYANHQGLIPDALETTIYFLLGLGTILVGYTYLVSYDPMVQVCYFLACLTLALQPIIITNPKHSLGSSSYSIIKAASIFITITNLFFLLFNPQVQSVLTPEFPLLTLSLITTLVSLLRLNIKNHNYQFLSELAELFFFVVPLIILANLLGMSLPHF